MFENLEMGSTGDMVVILQQKLKMLGFYNAVITGEYSLATKEGVLAFQREVGLPKTGIVNQETYDKLMSYTELARSNLRLNPTLNYGDTGSYVRELQTKLKALLYYTGSINSEFDNETLNAVKRFQLNNNLSANGIVNNETWDLLNFLYGNLSQCALNDEVDNNLPYQTYKVVKGDTLYKIAQEFNTTVDEIKRLNNLTSNNLAIGQELKIPTTTTNYQTYKVVGGDTLYKIAQEFNTTVDEIKRLNNLTSNNLAIGQELKIPKS